MSDRKYIACKFRSTDTRSYTYHYDGEEPLQVGDHVKVPDRSGDGWKPVEVVVISDEIPPFPTKGIIGLYNPDAEPAETEQPTLKREDSPLDDDKILF